MRQILGASTDMKRFILSEMKDVGLNFSILRLSGVLLGALTNFIIVFETISGLPESGVLSMLFIRTVLFSLPFVMWAGISIFTAKSDAESFYHHLTCLILIFMFPIFFFVDATLIEHPPGELFPSSVIVIASFPITVPILFAMTAPLGPKLKHLFCSQRR